MSVGCSVMSIAGFPDARKNVFEASFPVRLMHCAVLSIACLWGAPAIALPPPEDLPEEILRQEIIFEGRSPLDGEPMSPSEYAELEEFLAADRTPPNVANNVEGLIILLRIRSAFRALTPF